jgi:hypothetical protein
MQEAGQMMLPLQPPPAPMPLKLVTGLDVPAVAAQTTPLKMPAPLVRD